MPPPGGVPLNCFIVLSDVGNVGSVNIPGRGQQAERIAWANAIRDERPVERDFGLCLSLHRHERQQRQQQPGRARADRLRRGFAA